MLDKSGMLKCYLKSPAQKGLANKELIKNLADVLKVPQAAIAILAGDTARTKKIKIEKEITFLQLLAVLGLEALPQQNKLF